MKKVNTGTTAAAIGPTRDLTSEGEANPEETKEDSADAKRVRRSMVEPRSPSPKLRQKEDTLVTNTTEEETLHIAGRELTVVAIQFQRVTGQEAGMTV